MSSQKKETVLRQKRPNAENESIAEVGSSKKQPRIEKEIDQSISSRLFEKFEMNIGSKPTNFTGRSEIYNVDNIVQQIELEIGVGKDSDMELYNYEGIFSWTFENEITDESWPHIQHWFSHLLEPHGTIKYVSLVPFDMKIWNDLKKSHPNVVSRICAVELEIEFELHELDWVINFASRYCSAKTLNWTLWSTNDHEDKLILKKECLAAIGGFIGSQGDNFDKLKIDALNSSYCISYNGDELAVEIVKIFQSLEDPSKMVREISLELCDSKDDAHYQVEQNAKGFPFCLDENKSDIFKRVFTNQNSDYVLETSQSVDEGSRVINFKVIEPTLQ
ncbi:hypothetical protein Ddc_24095 [Ditylenchus destructor]|nr:hypothetical protein Ddc_24095 [Ditylenchus destructor]